MQSNFVDKYGSFRYTGLLVSLFTANSTDDRVVLEFLSFKNVQLAVGHRVIKGTRVKEN